MIEITTDKNKYLVPEWTMQILADLSDFDVDFILQKIEEGKALITPEKAFLQ